LAAVGVLTTGIGLAQARDLRDKWVTHFRSKASQCQGPTEGLELHQSAGSSSSSRRCISSGAEDPGEGWAPLSDLPAVGESSDSQRPTLLIFLGDSLVSGVGAQDEGSEPAAAALPRNVAARFAQGAGVQVRWVSVGITGADVQQLRNEGLPKLREKIEAYKAQAATVVVVLVVGVNDLRKVQLATYRSKLRHLCDELKYIVCEDRAVDAIVLPALRICDAPLLNIFPLNYFVALLCTLWEREKHKAVSWLVDAHVLPFPSPPNGERQESMFCPDGVHPSAFGYEWWADSLAKQIHCVLRERQARLNDLANPHQLGEWATMPL